MLNQHNNYNMFTKNTKHLRMKNIFLKTEVIFLSEDNDEAKHVNNFLR